MSFVWCIAFLVPKALTQSHTFSYALYLMAQIVKSCQQSDLLRSCIIQHPSASPKTTLTRHRKWLTIVLNVEILPMNSNTHTYVCLWNESDKRTNADELCKYTHTPAQRRSFNTDMNTCWHRCVSRSICTELVLSPMFIICSCSLRFHNFSVCVQHIVDVVVVSVCQWESSLRASTTTS